MIDQILENTANDVSSKVEYSPRFKAAINYAKNKIAKERYAPDYSETVTLTNELYNINNLSKSVIKIKKITTLDGYELDWERISTSQIRVYGQESVIILYSYLPANLVNPSDVLDFPLSIVDPQILCFYATYHYFLVEAGDDDKDSAGFWLNLWNDGFENIQTGIGEIRKIKDVYGVIV